MANGILFRSDVHTLFDRRYVTVDPAHHFVVSKRIKEELENGKDYYALHGAPLRLPGKRTLWPSDESLKWHNDEIFRG